MNRKRAISLSIMSVLFAWLSFAGIAYATISIKNPEASQHVGVHPQIMAVIALGYAVAAAAVAVGAWRRARWLASAVIVWGIVLGVLMVALQSMLGVDGEPIPLIVAPYVLFGVIVWLLALFAIRLTRRSAT